MQQPLHTRLGELTVMTFMTKSQLKCIQTESRQVGASSFCSVHDPVDSGSDLMQNKKFSRIKTIYFQSDFLSNVFNLSGSLICHRNFHFSILEEFIYVPGDKSNLSLYLVSDLVLYIIVLSKLGKHRN